MNLSFLSQIKVRSKLVLGFGLVLLLTGVIALSAWWALDNLSDTATQLKQVDEIEELSQELDHAVLGYQGKGGSQERERVVQLMQRMDVALTNSQQIVSLPKARQLINELVSKGSAYEQAFSELSEAMQSRAQFSQRQAQAGALVIKAFHDLDRNLIDNQPFDAETTLELTRWTFENYRDFLIARFQLMRYEQVRHDLNLQQQGLEMARHVLDKVSTMSNRFSQQDHRLVAGEQALNNYLAAYEKVAAAFIAEDKAVLAMDEANDHLLRLAKETNALLTQSSLEQTTVARTTIIVASVLAVVLGLIIAQLITQQIVTPLQKSLDIAERIANGDLREHALVRRADEFGALESRMATMRGNLRELIINIDSSTNQIASAAEELSAVTTQTSQGAQRQLDETSMAGQGMQEMTATVQDVAQNAEQASVAADNADQEAQNVARLAGKTLEQIAALTAQVERSMQVMQELQQESDKIGSVLDVIKSVAEQTNLLALNAAIEAARAGEQGRGFAVVADEVRALAQRTQQSAQEIEALIGGLQSGTQQAVEAMNAGREMSVRTVEMGQATGSSIEVITQMVSDIQGMNRQIATAADQQTSVANELTRGVISVREISEQTAAASNQTAAASQELAKLGAELQALIRRFSV